MPSTPNGPRKPPRVWYSRGYLPHLDVPGVTQFVTFRLADSVPRRLLRAYARVASESADGAQSRIERHLERYLGKGRGAAVLADPTAAQLVEDALLFYEGRHYALLAWVVMPNHVHVVLKPTGTAVLSTIVKRWKTWTAARINELFHRSGALWQHDAFDRWLRDDESVASAIRYVELNPVKAGLCGSPLEWPFSSAQRNPERWGGSSSVRR